MFKSVSVGNVKEPLIVVAVFADSKQISTSLGLDAETRKTATAALSLPGFKADAGEVVPAAPDLLLVGLGSKNAIDESTLRSVGARLIRRLDRFGPRAVDLRLSKLLPKRRLDGRRAGQAIGEGMGLANWRVDFFDGSATKRSEVRPGVTIHGDAADFQRGLREGLELADCVNEARRVAATPPNICQPTWVAKECKRLAKAVGLSCRVISAAEAEKQGMGGIVNVGRGSEHPPCMIILEHKPTRPRRGKKIALVGKTMTYDTGGYSLKPTAGMKGMKYDGNGGCAVLGAMIAIARAKSPVHVVALLPCAENMVSGTGYRPDDIITMYNGAKVEVTNTDAEGRLILADALAYACKQYEPTAIIDVATLTGGVVVALGSWCAGLFCNDKTLQRQVQSAADATGERVWPLPLWEEHRDFMRAQHADLWNSGPKRDGHPIQGAAFLSFFVDPDVPWAHIDIAGVSDVKSDTDLCVAGPTGFGVRLLTRLVQSL